VNNEIKFLNLVTVRTNWISNTALHKHCSLQNEPAMQKLLPIILFCFILIQSFGQAQQKVSTYLQAQYNTTLYDRTKGNNPWGMGVGLQLFFKSSKLRPTIDLAATAYLEDDKVFRMTQDGKPVDDIGGMVNLFAGAAYHPIQTIYLSLVAGPAYINEQVLLGVKPSFGFYFSEKQRWTGKISYINIFNRDTTSKEDFGSLSLSLGIKLF